MKQILLVGKRTAVYGLMFVLLATVSPLARVIGGDDNAHVMPVNSKPYGLSYGQWSAVQWQWAYSLPVDHHPLFDTADVSAGQSGPVWFLGGTYTAIETVPGVIVGKVTRNVTIPSSKSLFFPLVDVEAATLEGNGSTEAQLRDVADFYADYIVDSSLFCVIDGKSVRNLADFSVQSPLFVYGPLPDNNILQWGGLDAPKGSTSPSVSDGVFVMLAPLSVGKHTLHFGGTLDLSSQGGPVFIQDITYNITVVPKK